MLGMLARVQQVKKRAAQWRSAPPVTELELPDPHPAQRRFLETVADIAVFGGAAGGGKSAALLLAAAKHAEVEGYTAQIFRRELTQVKQQGGLWDKSAEFYGASATPNNQSLRWRFPSGATVGFAHLENENSKLNYQGAELAFIGFDEGTHFSETQFWYLYSRARTTCGVKPVIRLTTNPDPDSWLANFISWWIDPDSGFPIAARDGALRWFVRDGDAVVWFDTAEDARAQYPTRDPKSVTFICSKLEDNPSLASTDYKSTLEALPTVERERLQLGNWKIRAAAGLIFPRAKALIVDSAPCRVVSRVRAWDFGGMSDFTACVLLAKLEDGRWLVEDVRQYQGAALSNDAALLEMAQADGVRVQITIPQDPAEAGKTLARIRVQALAGYNIHTRLPTGDKQTRASPMSAQWRVGNILLLRGTWNQDYLSEMDGFPFAKHDDQVDASSDAFNHLELNKPKAKWQTSPPHIG